MNLKSIKKQYVKKVLSSLSDDCLGLVVKSDIGATNVPAILLATSDA